MGTSTPPPPRPFISLSKQQRELHGFLRTFYTKKVSLHKYEKLRKIYHKHNIMACTVSIVASFSVELALWLNLPILFQIKVLTG